jgi:hypothetical protein
MGSTNKRKNNDQPIIKRPKESTMGKPKDIPEQVADLCKVSFDVKVDGKPFIAKDANIELVENNSIYNIFLLGTQIGSLNEKLSGMVTKCSELGVKYKGRIVEDKQSFYARFIRVA